MYQAGLLTSGTRALIKPSHPIYANSGIKRKMSATPVTVARLRRIYTGFPILPGSLIPAT
ncbi:MAG: hypothetical protein NVS2B12_04020 [Ktedonobacteraceae bacterium]